MTRNPAWRKAQQAQVDMKREAVLQEAANVFNMKGYHATSLADVADRLHITKTALYYYVKNKNDLLYQCYVRSLEEIDQARDEANKNGANGLDKICKYASSEAFTTHEPAALLNEIDAIEDPRKRAELKKRLADAQRSITEWVKEGIGDRSIEKCDPELAGRFVMGAFNWVPRWIAGSDMSMEEITHYFVELTQKTLAPR
jgi:TetR/AcrR family transcriptional regulator